MLWLKGELDDAIGAFSEAIRLDPSYALARYNRGLVRQRKGELDKALADFNKAIDLDPAYADA